MLVDSVRCSSVLTAGVFETLGTLSRYPLMIALVTRFLFGEGRCALRTPTPITPSRGEDCRAVQSTSHRNGAGKKDRHSTTPRRTVNGSR